MRTFTVATALLFLSTVQAKITFSSPLQSTEWVQGNTYIITYTQDQAKTFLPDNGWQVDLMVLGAKCAGICTSDGPIARLADHVPSTPDGKTRELKVTIPSDFAHYGHGFFIQFSNGGNDPHEDSPLFTIRHRGVQQESMHHNNHDASTASQDGDSASIGQVARRDVITGKDDTVKMMSSSSQYQESTGNRHYLEIGTVVFAVSCAFAGLMV